MSRTIWLLAPMLPFCLACADGRASDTPDGRPATSGQVERRPTKEELQRQKEQKEIEEFLKKLREDRRKQQKELEDLKKELDEMTKEIDNLRAQTDGGSRYSNQWYPGGYLGLAQMPEKSLARTKKWLEEREAEERRTQRPKP